MSAVVLMGEAPKSGFKIVRLDHGDATVAPRLPPCAGDYIWTLENRFPYTLHSASPEAREATQTLLNATTDEALGAFTSAYGSLSAIPLQHKGGECTSLSDLRGQVANLQRLNEVLQTGGFTEVTPIPNGLVWSPFAVGFGYWLLPAEGPRGYAPVLMTRSLYSFIVHEIITLALDDRPLLVCEQCGRFQRPDVRRDARFCSDRCRVASHRMKRKRRPREPKEQRMLPGSAARMASNPAKRGRTVAKRLESLAGAAGLEPTTCGFGDRRSTN
jgi:hypothetical protein